MGLFSWVFFGALAGWVASLIVGNSGRQGCFSNIVVGVAGAFIGGFIVSLIQGEGMTMRSFDWDWYSFGVAVMGAVVLLFVTGRGKKKKHRR